MLLSLSLVNTESLPVIAIISVQNATKLAVSRPNYFSSRTSLLFLIRKENFFTMPILNTYLRESEKNIQIKKYAVLV